MAKTNKDLHKHVINKIIEVAIFNAGALELPLKHHFRSSGKGSRSALIAAMQSGNEKAEDLIVICAACECLHEASLVHDDLQDRDELRRGAETVWHKFGDDTAILLGDHLIACASKILLESKLPTQLKLEMLGMISSAISSACNGQLSQLNLGIGSSNATEFYEAAAANKTGAFFALPLKAAFSLEYYSREESSDSNPHYHEMLALLDAAGRNLGIGYQIFNDCKYLKSSKSFLSTRDWQQQLVTAPILMINRLSDACQSELFISSLREQVLSECFDWQQRAYARAMEQLNHTDSAVQKAISEFNNRFTLRTIDATTKISLTSVS